MKVVILAAGIGKRFRRINQPKTLTCLSDGQSILDHQLENLAPYVSLHHVIIVAGYRKEKLINTHPNLLYIYNAEYERENTSKSLLKAIYKLDEGEDLLWINGDVIFQSQVIEALLAKRPYNGMIVNVGAVGAEEVKYRTDGTGKIVEVSKEVQQAEGEALGINFFCARDLKILQSNLEKCNDQDYFEKGIERSIAQGVTVLAVPVSRIDCMEIDFPEDLEQANQMLQEW